MQLSLSDDQNAILGAIDSLAKSFASPPTDFRALVLTSADLDAALADGGFLDVAYDDELGPTTAALVVERLARLPYAIEAAASALVRPLLGALPRPICLVEAGKFEKPVRFLQAEATVIVLDADEVTSFTAMESDVRKVESLYAYPTAMLNCNDFQSRARQHEVTPADVKARWQISLAGEIAGLLQAALDSVVLYVSERKQFGRPIATFQSVRHRLAEANVRTTGTRWLALKAANSGDVGDAALAAHYAQESATEMVYDFHQFLGAMGVTLEHPLHLWTYRLKALLSDLGGRYAQAASAAELIWEDKAA